MQVADSRAPIPKSPNASELQNVLLVEKGWMSSNELDMYWMGHLSDQSTRKANSMPFHSIAKRQAITRGPSMRLGQAATWENSTTVPGKSVMNWNNCRYPKFFSTIRTPLSRQHHCECIVEHHRQDGTGTYIWNQQKVQLSHHWMNLYGWRAFIKIVTHENIWEFVGKNYNNKIVLKTIIDFYMFTEYLQPVWVTNTCRYGAADHVRFPSAIPSGKLSHNYGKIHHFSWVNPLFQWPCSIAKC